MTTTKIYTTSRSFRYSPSGLEHNCSAFFHMMDRRGAVHLYYVLRHLGASRITARLEVSLAQISFRHDGERS